jgi:hypothetical protein
MATTMKSKLSSALSCHVIQLCDISENHTFSIFRVKEYVKQEIRKQQAYCLLLFILNVMLSPNYIVL